MLDFLVVIAYYDKGNCFRQRNAKFVVNNWLKLFPEANVCVVEQNSGKLFSEFKHERFSHIDVQLDDVFHKTVLLNKAIRSIESKAYIMADADAIVDASTVQYIRDHWTDGSLVFPYSDVIYMNEFDTRRIVAGNELSPGTKDHGISITRQTGLCNVFSRDTFNAVGGFDESFDQWGAEDDAFLVKCRRIVGPIVRNTTNYAMLLHMFHPKINTPDYIKSLTYISNRKRCACIRRMTDADLAKYVAGDVPMADMVEKYEKLGRLNVELKWHCCKKSILIVDTTIYDIDYSGDMSFSKVLDAVVSEDGPQYGIEFIDTIIRPIPDLYKEQIKEINEYRDRLCNLVKTTQTCSGSQN